MLEIATGATPDLIIMDFKMPFTDGIQVTKTIRE